MRADDDDRPTANFTFSPTAPVTGESISFTSTSRDTEGKIVSTNWDLDNDGSYDDGSGTTVTRTFATAGSKTVRIRVVDDEGESRTASKTVTVVANGAPSAVFSADPATVDTGQSVTLTSSSTDPEGRPLTHGWDTNDNGSYGDASGQQATVSFPNDGTFRVGLRVTDSGGLTSTTFKDIVVRNRLPQADFTMSDSEVDTGDPVKFTSTSDDPDGQVASSEWDFDGDGTADASGGVVTHSFTDEGDRTVTLTVTDDDGAVRTSSRVVRVNNRKPTASFTFAPAEPFAADEVVFTSTSTDPDGSVAKHNWDLDGDGDYDDATGPEAKTSFPAGVHTVALEVVDDDGRASSPAFDSVEVTERPTSPPPPADGTSGGSIPLGSTQTQAQTPTATARAAPRLLSPFPRVRINGAASASSVRVDFVNVRTPSGTRIVIRCKGRGCPYARAVQTQRWTGGKVRTVRIKGFKRRTLRAGAVLEIYVIKRGVIGKYTRFRFRRLKPPVRVDRCTAVGKARPQRCPSA